MAKYRPVHINIWKDPDFESYSPTMKLIFLYLCTNETTTESGIYPITMKTISNETGIPSKTVGKLLSNGLKNITYDFKNNIVFVKNFLNYNGGGRPDLLQKSIERDYKFYKTELWNEFIKTYPEWSGKLKPIISNTNSISNTISNTNTKEELANSLETVENNKEIIKETILYLNKKTGKNFRPDSKIAVVNITARINEKHTLEEFKKVIDIKCSHWLNPKKGETDMSIYLSPDTLFGNKFEKYLNQNANKEAIQEAKIKEKEWKKKKDDYEWKPIPSKIKEQTHKVLNIPDRDKLNKLKGDK